MDSCASTLTVNLHMTCRATFPLWISLKFTVFPRYSFISSMYAVDSSRAHFLVLASWTLIVHRGFILWICSHTILRLYSDKFVLDYLKYTNYNREKPTTSSRNFYVTASPKPKQEFMQYSEVKIAILNTQLADLLKSVQNKSYSTVKVLLFLSARLNFTKAPTANKSKLFSSKSKWFQYN